MSTAQRSLIRAADEDASESRIAEERPRRLVVAYDIPSDSARSAVASLLKGFGIRVQFSVFECHLTGREQRRLVHGLSRLVGPAMDQVGIFDCADTEPGLLNDYRETSPDYWVA